MAEQLIADAAARPQRFEAGGAELLDDFEGELALGDVQASHQMPMSRDGERSSTSADATSSGAASFHAKRVLDARVAGSGAPARRAAVPSACSSASA